MKIFISIFITIVLTTLFLEGQQVVKFKKTDGTVDTYKLIEIDSVVITEGASTAIELLSVKPKEAKSGDTISLIGTGFGVFQENCFINFCGSIINSTLIWNDTLIEIIVPISVKSGKIRVITNEAQSNDVAFYNILSIFTNISGRVIDENGESIVNADIICNGKKVKSDTNGLFLFENIEVQSNRCYVTTKKDGFFDMARAAVPTENGTTELQISMMKKNLSGIFHVKDSTKILLNDSASIKFIANSIMKSDSSSYDGEVHVFATFLNPESVNFSDNFQGDALGLDKNGNFVRIFSYGVQNIEIETPTKEKLLIKNGFTAELSIMFKSNMPDTIPMWYFDFDKGYWIEYAKSIKNNNNHIAHVTHFSPDNWDKSPKRYDDPKPDVVYRPAYIKGRVLSCNDNERIQGAKVIVGQQTVVTDNFGNFRVTVPSFVPIDVYLAPPKKSNKFSYDYLTEDQEIEVTLTEDSMTVVKGIFVDCDSIPITKQVLIKWKNGFSSCLAIKGEFSLSVEPQTPLELYVSDSKFTITPLYTCTTKNLGKIRVCDQIVNSILDLALIPGIDTLKSFYIHKYEITEKIWKKVMGDIKGRIRGDTMPYIPNISDLYDFCNQLSIKEGIQPFYTTPSNPYGYRLPIEREWYLACVDDLWNTSGSGNLDPRVNAYAWCLENAECKLHPVGKKKPNKYGIYDMYGNVAEYIDEKIPGGMYGLVTKGLAWNCLSHWFSIDWKSWDVWPWPHYENVATYCKVSSFIDLDYAAVYGFRPVKTKK